MKRKTNDSLIDIPRFVHSFSLMTVPILRADRAGDGGKMQHHRKQSKPGARSRRNERRETQKRGCENVANDGAD